MVSPRFVDFLRHVCEMLLDSTHFKERLATCIKCSVDNWQVQANTEALKFVLDKITIVRNFAKDILELQVESTGR